MDNESKIKILNAAENLFSEKGFEATRVNDISELAKVNKALIYYYFESKKEILDTLFNSLIEDVKVIFFDEETISKIMDIKNIDLYNKSVEIWINKVLDFLISKRKIIKVLLKQALNTVESKPLLFSISDILINQEIKKISEKYDVLKANSKSEFSQIMVTEFFTGFMPMINFVAFYDDWISYYNFSEVDLRNNFVQAFKDTHLAYHEKRLN